MKKKTKWVNVRVPEELIEEVDRYIQQSKGSFTSRADFVKNAIREKINKEEDLFLVRDLVSKIEKNPELKRLLKKK